MAEPRQRKPAAGDNNTKSTPSSSTSSKRHNSPNRATQDPIFRLSPLLTFIFGPGIMLALLGYGGYHFYQNSTFSGSTTHKQQQAAAAAQSAKPSTPDAQPLLHLTDSQLAPFTGANPDLPIYLSLNKTIYNVTASPSFYGPTGPYAHFSGRDASRAWVSECFSPPEQLTWDLSGVEEMFMPRWLDEEMEAAAEGRVAGDLGDGVEGVVERAKAVVGRVGVVGEEERVRRREADVVEAREAVERALGHWVGFFEGSGKYPVVGYVDERERVRGGEVPELCEAALKKRPVRGGKLQAVLDAAGPGMAGGAAAGGGGGRP